MKIALITQTSTGSDHSKVTAQLLFKGPAELKVVGSPLHIFDTIELDSKEEQLMNHIMLMGNPNTRNVLNELISKVATSAYYKGNAHGHNEAVMERD